MSTEETIAALVNKLKELEAKITQPGATGGEPPQPSQPTIKVTVPREKKITKYAGAKNDKLLEDWIADATRATRGRSDSDAVDFLVYHLEGAAKDEVRLRPASEWSTPTDLFKVLRATFGEQLTATQAMRKFFGRRQQEREPIQDFAHSLMILLSRVERLDSAAVPEKDKLLRDQFLENLRDSTLRREVRRWVRDHPEKTFNEIREEVQQWLSDDEPSTRRAGSREMAATFENPTQLTCGEVSGQQKLISDLITGQKVLADGLQKQQEALARHIEEQGRALARQNELLVGLMSKLEKDQPRGKCYECGSPQHYRNRCPKRKPGMGGSSSKPDEPQDQLASNTKAPRQ